MGKWRKVHTELVGETWGIQTLGRHRRKWDGKGKGKVHPRTGHKGPERKKRYTSTLSLTSAQDGVSGQVHAPAALPPGKGPVPIL